MKTALLSLLTATLLGFANQASGRSFDAATCTSILFAAGLAGWTIAQYSRPLRSLSLNRPIRLPVDLRARTPELQAERLAA